MEARRVGPVRCFAIGWIDCNGAPWPVGCDWMLWPVCCALIDDGGRCVMDVCGTRGADAGIGDGFGLACDELDGFCVGLDRGGA